MAKEKQKLTDKEILNGIRDKNQINEVLKYLYSNCYAYLETCILRKYGDQDDAADIIQETFLVFIDLVINEKFREQASIKSMLYSIANNLWVSELRKRSSMNKRNEAYESEKDIVQMDMVKRLEQFENKKFVMDIFESLGSSCKDLLIKFYYLEMSMKDILLSENYANEQVLRNKKYKCLQGMIKKIENNPMLYQSLKTALKNG
ncbi:RNA polymerase sigma factor [Aquiflexum lacus]|uniref:RNA polymerase sigma factor n=1 Tax=Aquiflexum lacus TaxID=2483805 RepID=UPI001894018B|nr:sigma-70 family RNA polymerase sigma factor [Aquiflexum lacus]